MSLSDYDRAYSILRNSLTNEHYRLLRENFFFKNGIETLARMLPHMLESLAKTAIEQERDRQMQVEALNKNIGPPIDPAGYFKRKADQ